MPEAGALIRQQVKQKSRGPSWQPCAALPGCWGQGRLFSTTQKLRVHRGHPTKYPDNGQEPNLTSRARVCCQKESRQVTFKTELIAS